MIHLFDVSTYGVSLTVLDDASLVFLTDKHERLPPSVGGAPVAGIIRRVYPALGLSSCRRRAPLPVLGHEDPKA